MGKKNRVIEMLKNIVSNIWYMVALVAVCAIVIVAIVNWERVFTAIGNFLSVVAPFIIGFFFACFINPMVRSIRNQMDRIKSGRYMALKKAIALLVSYIIVVGVVTIIIVYIFPQIRDSVKEMWGSLRNGYQYVSTHKEELNTTIPFINLGDVMGNVFKYIEENLDDNILTHGATVVPFVYRMSSSIFSTIYNILMGLVISIYLVIDGKNLIFHLKRGIYAIVPRDRADSVWATMGQCNHIFNGFLIGKAIDSLIIGIICLIAMSILRLPYALFMSVIVGLTNMIPYFGPIIGAIPGVLIYLVINPKLSLIFAIMILVLQQFDGLYLGPKILGDLTGIKPLWVIFGITVGGAYFGFVGMFLGVPTVAVLMYLVNLFVEKKLNKKGVELFDSK